MDIVFVEEGCVSTAARDRLYSLCGLALFVWVLSMWPQSFAVAVSL